MKAFYLILICIFSFSGIKAQKASSDKRTAPLSQIVELISDSWTAVRANDADGVVLKSVTASFTVSKNLSGGGELKIWIFKIGRKVERSSLHTVTLELSKIPTNKRLKAKAIGRAEDLTTFIEGALTEFKKINNSTWLPDLQKRTILLEIGLTVTNSTTLGGGYDIGIFSLTAEGGRTKEQGHTLTLEFERTLPN